MKLKQGNISSDKLIIVNQTVHNRFSETTHYVRFAPMADRKNVI